MSLVITVGRVTADFEMQMSANNTPYVRFTVVENIGYGENARAQYLQVWARAENAISLVKGKVRKGACFGSAANWSLKSSSGATRPGINGSK